MLPWHQLKYTDGMAEKKQNEKLRKQIESLTERLNAAEEKRDEFAVNFGKWCETDEALALQFEESCRQQEYYSIEKMFDEYKKAIIKRAATDSDPS